MDTVFLLFSFVLGAVVGSFLNVVILRLPIKGTSIAFPPSHCPHCRTRLRWYDNIPLLSFFLLRARCRYCRMSISWQYPAVELAMALFSLLLFRQFSVSFDFFYYFVFTAALLAIAVIDIHHQIIPDRISLPGIVAGLAGSLLATSLTWQESLLGLLCGGGILYAIALGYYLLTGREGMGGGDIKLLAMLGAFLGWRSLLFIIFASSTLGTVVGLGAMLRQKKGGQTRIPFGPFLSAAAMLWLFFQAQILELWSLYLHGTLF